MTSLEPPRSNPIVDPLGVMDSSNSYKPPNLWDDRMSPRGSSTANYSQRNNTASTRLNENRDRGNLKNQPDDYDDLYVDDTMDIVDDDETMSSSFYSASSSPRDGPTSLPDEKTAGDNPAQQPGDTSGNIPELDLVERIDGMFRILDLISERGSGGLVDKIIIAQDQFSHFINELYPGSYRSLTKIDFHLLDKGVVKPMGIYGSKAEIVRLMRSIGAIDEEIEKLLLACRDVSSSVSKPDLRPGLYALLSPKRHGVDRNLYIIFWPEETTWNDDAISTVARNRVTFLRYLTQTTDQVIALVSDEHCKKLVWADEQDSIVSPLEEDDSERLFTFEVSKTNEQEEDVKFYPGFIIKHTALKTLTAIEGVEDAKLEARFVGGESHQAIMSGEYVPASKENRRCWESYTSTHLRSFLTNAENILRFDYHLTNDSIKILVENGLKSRYGSAVKIWEDGQKNLERDSKEFKAKSEADIRNKIEADSNKLSSALEYMLIAKILEMFPTLERCRLQAPDQLTEMTAEDRQIFISELFTLHTDIEKDNKFQEHVDVARSTKKTPRSFVKTKAIVLMCRDFFAVFELVEEKEKLLQLLISEDTKKAELFLRERTIENTSNSKRSTFGWVKNIIFWDTSTSSSGVIKEAKESALKMDDHEYVNILDSIVKDEPILAGVAEESMKCLNEHLADQTQAALKKLKARTQYLQEDVYKQELSKQRRIVDAQAEKALREQLLSALNGSEDGGGPDGENAPHVITVENVESPRTYSYSSYAHFKLSLTHYTRKDPVIRYSIDPLLISQRDKHEMQMRPDHIPSPSFATRFSTKFSLPVECSIKQLYLLDGDRCLLIVDDHRGHLKIYLEELTCIDGAIRQGSHGSKKVLHKDKMGENAVVTFDERKRMIAVCGCDRVKGVVQLHTFVFDERFTSLQGQGTAINLTAWYEESPSIHLMCFVSGTEEIALVEAGGRTRIFSFITQQFRPAVLLLPSCPSAAFSSPDGACFITVLKSLETSHVYAHHWSSFGSGQGFHYDISGSLDKVHMITSLGQRNNVQLLGINIQTGTCQSIRMDIKRQITEYLFRERGAREFQVGNGRSTMHNCLLDCHSDVWTRYPVIPAISRQTILSEDRRKSKCLRYIAIDSHPAFARYFLDMVQTVERTTRKPIGSILGGISVSGESFSSLVSRLNRDADWQGISSFMAGEWLVNLICLIPIHIAVARDNRFIPLKDGEQSVGKSYALNHLVDTSFAGSAMRTTEGVWITSASLNHPIMTIRTGVHSIERSAQEDTLLVLFNTAISNLVLFRNNFAISRDITNLFQSFQSSSSVLDPAANPTLFQSTLVIIIKDVIDSDKTEIKQEFVHSIHHCLILQEEQGSNFLTRLHKGQLSIVPWPVIESRQFYTLFGVLRKRLESTPPTYHEAGRFLHTLKVLMAKLKANDWGSMSQSLASHRGQHLLSLLPHALAFGATEIEPEYEQLRNFDTNSIIVADDTNARFWVKSLDEGKDADEQDILLRKLCESWPDFGTRTFCEEVIWMERLTEYLDDLVTRRLAHVLQWIESNIDRFASGGTHAALDKLRRAYEEESVEIKRTTQFCKTQLIHTLQGLRIHILKMSEPILQNGEVLLILHENYLLIVPNTRSDAMCSGPEHEATASRPAQPSYCTLPVFHPPQRVNPSGLGHVSNDGHAFTCKNPSVMQQAFHVIFVIDQSGSMTATDRGPLANTPSTARIRRSANNRFGAVCSSLHAFWTARMPVGAANQSSAARRDAYSAILFDSSIKNCFTNDFTRSPDELLDVILGSQLWGGTNFDLALQAAQNVMTTNWSTERTPVVIFLSDGECHVSDARIYDVCRAAVRLGKSLSFHSVSFGPDTSSQSLRRMAQIAREVAASAPRDPLLPAAAQVDSQYTVALDTVNLAETFLGIAESLRKPHASLLRSSH
ncbi:hypothetical protein BD410DRAFT_839090 [Rickenella mellea]|uniref:VWFA domain-containing protein n=1 Tax=Rickenella mellea TaxID=50990 RepID=A0A4Y7Q777_9AGAM|nr:hypothetical protein BD410DRAFT_839090 [Rickenella mellea]